MAQKDSFGMPGSYLSWAAIALLFWVASHMVSEVSNDKYVEIKAPCAKDGLMYEECKDIMSDKKMTELELLLFQNELAEKEKGVAVSNLIDVNRSH